MKVEWSPKELRVNELRRDDGVVFGRVIESGPKEHPFVGYVYNGQPLPRMALVCTQAWKTLDEACTFVTAQFLPSNDHAVA